jgi:prevent-host-death family protein
MLSVNIADLKNNLSRYLRQVRDGEEIIVRDRDTLVARIVPLSWSDNFDQHLEALPAAGKLRLPEGQIPSKFWSEPRPRISLQRLLAAVEADRNEDDKLALAAEEAGFDLLHP